MPYGFKAVYGTVDASTLKATHLASPQGTYGMCTVHQPERAHTRKDTSEQTAQLPPGTARGGQGRTADTTSSGAEGIRRCG